MIAPERGARRVRRVGLALLAGVLAVLPSCRSSGAPSTPQHLGDFRTLEPENVDEAYRADWDALQRAREANPADVEVARAADRLLARQPPVLVKLHALLARAEQAYLTGDDPVAIKAGDEGLTSVKTDPRKAPPVVVALTVVRARALVRGGDPSRAVEALTDPVLSTPGALGDEERQGLRAVALDRNAAHLEAALAYLRWRELLADDDPAALYAEERYAALVRSLDGEAIAARAADLPSGPMRACLEAHLGRRPTGDSPTWVQRCGQAGSRVGILLPRTGPFSALADPQLAAATVAVEVLLDGDPGTRVIWRDSGSTPAQAVAAARALVASGADVIVGPIGAGSIEAVAGQLGSGVSVVVPGEGLGRTLGVAPPLEKRIAALVDHAVQLRATRLVVAAPDNGYGRRAVKAIEAAVEGRFSKPMIIQTYSPSTTSFAPTLSPMLPALGKGAAILVPDHLSRVELIVRQLARAGLPPSVDGSKGPIVLSTAEGAGADSLGAGHEILEGMWVAPVAFEHGSAATFVAAFTRAEGHPPEDQALLVYYALRQALLGDSGGNPRPVVAVVEGGRIVPSVPPTR